MKKFIYFLICFLATHVLHAQTTMQADTVKSKVGYDSAALIKVEFESQFPGGDAAWRRFLQNNLVYPDKAVRKKIQGTVVLQFIVDKTGLVSDITAISGPQILGEAAIKALGNTPRWKPAFQNGKAVKSYKKQPIDFKLQ